MHHAEVMGMQEDEYPELIADSLFARKTAVGYLTALEDAGFLAS